MTNRNINAGKDKRKREQADTVSDLLSLYYTNDEARRRKLHRGSGGVSSGGGTPSVPVGGIRPGYTISGKRLKLPTPKPDTASSSSGSTSGGVWDLIDAYTKRAPLERVQARGDLPTIRHYAKTVKGKGPKFSFTGGTGTLDIGNSFLASTYSSQAHAILLNGMQKGTDVGQRVGRKVRMTKIGVKLLFYNGNGPNTNNEGPLPGFLRCTLIYDNQWNGAAANAGTGGLNDFDLWDSTGSPEQRLISFMRKENFERFIVLHSEYIELCLGNTNMSFNATSNNPNAILGAHGHLLQIFKGVGMDVIYNAGNTGTCTDINSGALWVLINWSPNYNSQPAKYSWTCAYQARLRYKDY